LVLKKLVALLSLPLFMRKKVQVPLKISLPLRAPENKAKRRAEVSYLSLENQTNWKKRDIIAGRL